MLVSDQSPYYWWLLVSCPVAFRGYPSLGLAKAISSHLKWFALTHTHDTQLKKSAWWLLNVSYIIKLYHCISRLENYSTEDLVSKNIASLFVSTILDVSCEKVTVNYTSSCRCSLTSSDFGSTLPGTAWLNPTPAEATNFVGMPKDFYGSMWGLDCCNRLVGTKRGTQTVDVYPLDPSGKD
jgi:hypothetical protein